MTPAKSQFRRLLRWCFAGLGAFALLSILAVVILRFVPPFTSAMMIERWIDVQIHGDAATDNKRPSGKFRLHYRWTVLDRISPDLWIAVVASEDQKFPFHHGFDIEAIQTALTDADDGERLRGASTISQQVAKNLFLWSGRSFVRKSLEAWFTVLIEALWPKRRILEIYLNIAEFGDGIYGAEPASKAFFGISAAGLDAEQAAQLAAVLPNPRHFRVNPPSSFVLQRVRWIRRQMQQLGGSGYLPFH